MFKLDIQSTSSLVRSCLYETQPRGRETQYGEANSIWATEANQVPKNKGGYINPPKTTLLRLATLVYSMHALVDCCSDEEEGSKVIELFSPWGRPGSFFSYAQLIYPHFGGKITKVTTSDQPQNCLAIQSTLK